MRKVSTGFGIALLLLAFGGAVTLVTQATSQVEASAETPSVVEGPRT